MRLSLAATAAVVLAVLAAACGHSGPSVHNAEMGSFRVTGIGADADPTVRPARLVPEVVDETTTYGLEAGGGVRAMVAGLRVVTSQKGAIVVAEDRLPQAPRSSIALPERLGGGFLFVIGATLWRADRWLGQAKPIFTAPQQVQSVMPGLDRVYVRAENIVLAIDGRTGQALDLGPWPASPYVASYAAADGWRAAAVTDMRGVIATFDAGATWRALDLPLEPKQVVASGDSIDIGGFELGQTETWYELRADGSVARLGAVPRDAKTKLSPTLPVRPASFGTPIVRSTPQTTTTATAQHLQDDTQRQVDAERDDVGAKIFGKRPLAAAIEDGWPLTDGTAVVARNGALARVRLSDGALVELVRDAFQLKPARCHPITLTRPRSVGAFGFVCGEPRGTTVIYAYEPHRGRLTEIKHFDRPRVVTSSGNGALAVRGPCAEDGEPTPAARPSPVELEKLDNKNEDEGAPSKANARAHSPHMAEPKSPGNGVSGLSTTMHPYCVLGHDDRWREVHVRDALGDERVVVLADGRIVVVSPPQGLGTPARMTVLENGRATTAPVTFPRVANDVGRSLRFGLWLDGFEERRPGVIGGWIEAGGAMLGIEISLDGKATLGQFIRDAGMPFVSGRYGFGWTASRRAYETTDGGMTWSNIDVPDPLVPVAKVERRACGPVGCIAHGWLRVGWGETKHAPPPSVPAPHRETSAPLKAPHVQLSCEPLASMPAATAAAARPPPVPLSSTGRVHLGGFGGPPVLGTFNGLRTLPPFFAQPAQALRESERGINIDVASLARIYGWGPRTGEWETLGRWQVKWLSPFSGWPEVRASLPTPPPSMIVDMTRAGAGYYGTFGGTHHGFQLVPGDDAAHALLVGKRAIRSEGVMFELEADRAPVEIRRADGEPFGEIEGAVRAAGHWFVATPLVPSTASSPLTAIWRIEGAIARELVRIPRVTSDSPSSSSSRTKLARRADGRAIALIADGQPTAARSVSLRWALPVDVESGSPGEPEPLGYVDLAGRTLDACTDDALGWVLDTSIPSSQVRLRTSGGTGSINAVLARLRVTSARACIERLAGTFDDQSPDRAAQLSRPGSTTRSLPTILPGEIRVTAMHAQTRFPLRCSVVQDHAKK